MKTIAERIKDSERWKKAQETLRDFEESMKLIEKYPIQPMGKEVHSPPYDSCSKFYNY